MILFSIFKGYKVVCMGTILWKKSQWNPSKRNKFTSQNSLYECVINILLDSGTIYGKFWYCSSNSIGFIGLYTPINYFGRYATCSHKDGGRSHIQSRETIGQEDHVTCLKLRPCVNSSPAFLSHLQDAYFL